MLYKVERVAELLDLHPDTIRRYIREGKLKAYKIGKGFRIKKESLDKFLEERKH